MHASVCVGVWSASVFVMQPGKEGRGARTHVSICVGVLISK
jgi:hypothetical protein